MPLPNPGMDFTAFDTLPAAELDKLVENIEALADGSAFDASDLATTTLSNPYKFSVYRSAAYSMPNTAFNKVPFETENFDTGSNYNNTTNFRFVAPVGGFYIFSFMVATVIGGSDDVAAIYKNGTIYRWANETKGGGTGSPVLMSLATNDYIEIYVSVDNLALNVGNAPQKTYFDGYLLSTL